MCVCVAPCHTAAAGAAGKMNRTFRVLVNVGGDTSVLLQNRETDKVLIFADDGTVSACECVPQPRICCLVLSVCMTYVRVCVCVWCVCVCCVHSVSMCVHAFVCVCVSEYYVIFVRRHIWPRGVQTQHDFNGLVVGGATGKKKK